MPYTGVPDQKKVQLESAATAVIVVSAPTGHPEYPTADSFDVQLAITRNGVPIADTVIEYNAAVVQVSGAPSTDQVTLFRCHYPRPHPAPLSVPYVTIPPAPPSGAQAPALLLKSDSTPSPFDDLQKAIDGVLKDDPSGTSLVEYTLKANGQLSAAQCQQIAAEIIYNRGYSPATKRAF